MLFFPNSIERLTERNSPGACYLQFVPVTDIATFPEEVRGTLPTAITLNASALWLTIHPTQWTQEFDEEWLKKDGATYSHATLECIVPKDRAALLYGLWQLHHGRFVVLHHDLNGTVKVLGSKAEPAMLHMPKLEHGNGPGKGRNQYLLQVSITRRNACPSYLATPPAITPAVCPTLQQLLGAVTWATIQTLLSPTQLDDAEAAICDAPSLCARIAELIAESGATDGIAAILACIADQGYSSEVEAQACSTLCELIDAAWSSGGGGGTPGSELDAMVVSGAGEATANQVFMRNGDEMGRPWYQSGPMDLLWTGTAWYLGNGGSSYYSTEDVATPDLVTTWNTTDGFAAPPPTVTPYVDIDGMLVYGAIATLANQPYAIDGTYGGRPQYTQGLWTIRWETDRWKIITSASSDHYYSTDDVATPDLATTWSASGFFGTPVVLLSEAATGGGGGGPAAILDCLDSGQVDELIEALDIEGDPVIIQLQDSVGADIGIATEFLAGTTTTITAPDATYTLKDSAAATIGGGSIRSNGSANITAPDGTFQRKDSAGANIGSPIAVKSNETGVVATCPDGTVTIKNFGGTTLGTQAVKSNGAIDYVAPIPLKFGWAAGNGDTLTWTVTTDEAGTYGTYTPTGTNGTITYSKNGGGYAALSGSITLAVSDTITVRRTTTTSAGSVKWAA